MAGDSEVEPSSYFVLIALGEAIYSARCRSKPRAQGPTFQLVDLPVCLPPVGVFFVAAMIYVVSLPVRALCKVLPQKKRETPKRQAPSPEESSR